MGGVVGVAGAESGGRCESGEVGPAGLRATGGDREAGGAMRGGEGEEAAGREGEERGGPEDQKRESEDEYPMSWGFCVKR